MTFAQGTALALGIGALSMLAVALIGARRHWDRDQMIIAETGVGGALLVVMGTVSLALVVRGLLAAEAEPGMFTSTGEVSPRTFDYVIWAFIGIPIVGISVIVIALILGLR